MRSVLCLALSCYAAMCFSICLAQEELDVLSIKNAISKRASAFEAFRCAGKFRLERIATSANDSDITLMGNFSWLRSSDRFNVSIDFTGGAGEGFKKNAFAVKDASYRIVSDGENILVVLFSPFISRGCDADLYEGGQSTQYLHSCPYFPFHPHRGPDKFVGPKPVLESLNSLKLDRNGKITGSYSAGKSTTANYVFLKEFGFAYGGYEAKYGPNEVVIARDSWTYRNSDKGSAIPFKFETESIHPDNGTIVKSIVLEFKEFEFDPEVNNELFTLGGVDFCDGARVVDRTMPGDVPEKIIHSMPNDRFKSNSSRGIKSSLDQYRKDEHDAKKGPPLTSIPGVAVMSLICVGLFSLGAWLVSGRK